MAALLSLQDYNSSDSEEDSENGNVSMTKTETTNNKEKMFSLNTSSLSLPEEILNMFSEKEKSCNKEDSPYHGRIRSFPHQRGNWATHVFIHVVGSEDFSDLVSSLVNSLPKSFAMNKMEEFHLSLSRTVVLQHHWIQPFTHSLRKRLENYKKFTITFGSPEFYVNDERTRSFLGIRVLKGEEELNTLVMEVDKTLQEFRLQAYYTKASYHVSIGWSLGDVTAPSSSSAALSSSNMVNQELIPRLQTIIDDFSSANSKCLRVDVCEVRCKIGDKTFSVELK